MPTPQFDDDGNRVYTIPKTLGGCVDQMYRLREVRRKLEAEIDELKREEKAIENYLVDTLPKSDATGIQGKIAKGRLASKAIPTPRDWEAIYAYIHRQKAFHLLQRRLATSAVGEILENGGVVPGVEIFHQISMSITKR